MTRAEWTEGALAPAARDALARNLAKALPYPKEAQRVFLGLVDEAITEYTALRVPAERDGLERKARIMRLAKAAQDFAKSVAGLDEESVERVELSIWAAEGKSAEIRYFELVQNAGAQAGRVAGGCQHWIERNSSPSGPKTVGAIDGLVGELGRAYLAAFSERPSPSPNGLFVKTLTAIFRSASLPVHLTEPDRKPGRIDDPDDGAGVLGKTRLERIIETRVVGGTQPRRGRKRQN